MDQIKSLEDLNRAKEEALRLKRKGELGCRFIIRVATSSCGIAAGALETLAAIKETVSLIKLEGICIKEIGCPGLCSLEPVIQVEEVGHAPVTYGKVNRLIAQRIIQSHIEKGIVLQENVIDMI